MAMVGRSLGFPYRIKLSLSSPTVSGLFTKEVNLRLAKRPLKFNGRLANRGLTSLVKDATTDVFTGVYHYVCFVFY